MAARSTADVKLEIEVSQAFIEMATGQTNTRCPVALSLKGLDPNRIQRVKADRNEISCALTDHDVRYVWQTPVKVRNFIDAFDNGGRVAPFRFTLDTAKAIDVKPILHPSALALVRQAAWRAKPASEKTPRTKLSQRAVHVG